MHLYVCMAYVSLLSKITNSFIVIDTRIRTNVYYGYSNLDVPPYVHNFYLMFARCEFAAVTTKQLLRTGTTTVLRLSLIIQT